jgi:hypothetical protein
MENSSCLNVGGDFPCFIKPNSQAEVALVPAESDNVQLVGVAKESPAQLLIEVVGKSCVARSGPGASVAVYFRAVGLDGEVVDVYLQVGHE